MLSFFSKFKKNELCQLYIYPSVPDIDVCHSYFRITDKDILKSYWLLRVNGKLISPDLDMHHEFSDDKEQRFYRNRKNKSPIRMLARDLIWKFSHWYNRDLRAWLDYECPDRIFVAPGTATFLYKIALKISKDRNIPIVTYICDDYYFVKSEKQLLAKLHQKLLHEHIFKLVNKSSRVLTICDEMRDQYFQKFNIPVTTIMTGSNFLIQEDIAVHVNPVEITYMGNLRYNRFRSLVEIGHALDKINEKLNSNFNLKIYSKESDSYILEHFENVSSIRFCGFVGGMEFEKIFRSSQMLLHTESFDEASIDEVKHSVSTKIADSLGSGIPLFAYGPDSVASVAHLIRHQCAFVATSSEELEKTLLSIFFDSEKRKLIVKNALSTAHEYHDANKVSDKLYEILDNLR